MVKGYGFIAGALAVVILTLGLLILQAGLKPVYNVDVECNPIVKTFTYQGWIEKCEEEVRTIVKPDSQTVYFTATICSNIPHDFTETHTFQECVTLTKTRLFDPIAVSAGAVATIVAIASLIIIAYIALRED